MNRLVAERYCGAGDSHGALPLGMTVVVVTWSRFAGGAVVIPGRTAERHRGRSLQRKKPPILENRGFLHLNCSFQYAEREPATSRAGPMVLFDHRPTRTNWHRHCRSGDLTRLPSSTIHQARVCPPGLPAYFAYSTALVSRMTLTLIWPGYSSSASIFLAMSRARRIMLSSVTTSGLTMMRISRPAWMA